jgi:hypothetical protein
MWAFEFDTFWAPTCFGDVPAEPELHSSNSFQFFSVPCSSQQTGARNNLRPKIKKKRDSIKKKQTTYLNRMLWDPQKHHQMMLLD